MTPSESSIPVSSEFSRGILPEIYMRGGITGTQQEISRLEIINVVIDKGAPPPPDKIQVVHLTVRDETAVSLSEALPVENCPDEPVSRLKPRELRGGGPAGDLVEV